MKKKKVQSPVDPQVRPLVARRVLADVRLALRDFSGAYEAGDIARSRVYWITCLSLLRAVGHVLQSRDAERSKWIAEAAAKEFARCRERRFANLIYWEFIVEERNLLLKEYTASILSYEPEENGSDSTKLTLTNLLVGTEFYTPFDAINAALSWWAEHLTNVEARATALRHQERHPLATKAR